MRALWVCNVSAGPLPVHRHQARQGACWPGGGPSGSQDLPAEFDEVAGELGRTLDFAKVPKREKAEVPAAFAATKTRSSPATSRAANAAESPVFPGQTTPPRQSWVGAHNAS